MSNTIVHQKQFVVSKSIIKHHIFSQAGSLYKAILELVANEVDAKASVVNIDIDDDMNTIRVYGNGTGFTSLADVEKLFGCFGFDHETEEELSRNRTYGRFGMGRSQIFCFGKSTWLTNEFKMIVDLNDDVSGGDLPYILEECPTSQYDGCHITIDLYKSMDMWERRNLERDLKKNLLYVSCELKINGKTINTPKETVKWTAQEGSLAFKKCTDSSVSGLNVYNMGMYIRTYPHSMFGISGDLTSTDKAFDVNVARNDITQHRCELWTQIKPFIKPFIKKKQTEKLSDMDRAFMLRGLISGTVTFEEVKKQKTITLINGSHTTISRMLSFGDGEKFTISPTRQSAKGEKILSIKTACVLSPDTLENAGVDDLQEFFSLLEQSLRNEIQNSSKRYDSDLNTAVHRLSRAKILPFDDATEGLDDNHILLDAKQLTKLDKIKLKALTSLANGIASSMRQAFYSKDIKLPNRTIIIGESDTAEAWTDSNTYIAIDKDIVKNAFSRGFNGLIYIYNLIVHEYCHNTSSMGDHAHGEEFNQMFRDFCESRYYEPNALLQRCALSYFKARKKQDLDVSVNELGGFVSNFEKELTSIVN